MIAVVFLLFLLLFVFEPLTASALAMVPPGMQKQMLGEQLYRRVTALQPQFAGRITAMLLEIDNSEVTLCLP